jgi:hypothetical protein
MDELPRVTLSQARSRDLSPKYVRHRVASGRLMRLQPGVYFTHGTKPRPADRLAAAVAVAGGGAALSGAAALHLWGMRDVGVPAPWS